MRNKEENPYPYLGVNAINIYMSVVSAPEPGGASKRGLIDEVPSSDVYSQLQKLGTQNPACKSTFIFNRKYLQK